MTKLRKSTIPVFVSAVLLFADWGCGKDTESTAEKAAPGPSTQATGETKGYRAVDVENGGVISGKVIFQGKVKTPAIPATKDQEVCGKSKKDPSLLVSESGEVQNAVVYIADIHKGKNPYYSVTDDIGSFQLANVPPGNYTVQVWHVELGKHSKKVKVEPNGRIKLEFEFPRGTK